MKQKVQTKYGVVKFFCENKRTIKRSKRLLISEPETINWIDTFVKGDVLWDIGANIGCYSIYAALKPGVKVLAFEPASINYYVLNRNIEINKMDDRILAFCIAFNDCLSLDYFYLFSSESSTSHHNFGEAVGYKGDKFKPKLQQGMLGYPIDYFIDEFKPNFPSHIKIDVDGLEDNILDGATKTLKDNRLKSVLVEVDTAQKRRYKHILKTFENAGMEYLTLRKKSAKEKAVKDGSDLIHNFIFVKESK